MKYAWIPIVALVGCAGEPPTGLGKSDATSGTIVQWDLLARPLPRIPLPNDIATRIDDSSPTGRRLNVSLLATTRFEMRMRDGFDRLDGFGTYGAITVPFAGPLDVEALWERHNGGPWPDGGPNRDDFRDDAVFLINVDPDCARFGEEIALDIGRGRFPVVLDGHATRTPDPDAPDGYRLNEGDNVAFEYDPHAESNNLLYEERDEDLNGNGILDPGEDTDFDGKLDKPPATRSRRARPRTTAAWSTTCSRSSIARTTP